MSHPSPERWLALSPYLDDALGKADEERGAWLQSLRKQDPALADDLKALLDEHNKLSEEGFLDGAAVPTPPALAAQAIGDYTLVSLLGQGGMGSVWLAVRSDERLEGKAAVKLLNLAIVGLAGEERFKREGQILGRLTHPNIAHLIDSGVSPIGQPYLVLEHVDGRQIDRYCDDERLGIEARTRVVLDVLTAVIHAHARLIVHRDIKPSNVMVSNAGQVKLLDFGIAKLLESEGEGEPTALTRDGGGVLTPEYAAPEQLAGGAITTRTDVYALGILLYLLLSGRHPAGAWLHSPVDLLKAVVETEAPGLSTALAPTAESPGRLAEIAERRGSTLRRLRRALSGDLETIVARALRKDPQERYSSVAALADDLRRYLAKQPISDWSGSRTYRLGAEHGGQRVDLIERTRPLEDLGLLAAEAASGRGRLVLIGGEAGIGKTALVRQFTRSLSPNVRSLWGACDPLSLPRPLGPLVDVAPFLGDAFVRLLDREASRARLFAAVRDALQGATHVLVFEDVHWADGATLDLLRYLGRRLETTRTLLVATYRDDEVGPKHPLRIVLGDLAASKGVHRLALEPLTTDGVRRLASGSGIDPEDLHRRTGGNPFFVTELLAAGGALLPQTLKDAVLARASRLDGPARLALEAAAVLGARFDALLLREVAEVDEEALEECLACGALMPHERAVTFRHELVREAVLSAIPPARLVALHQRALSARRRVSTRADDLASLAHHAEAAGDGTAVLDLAPAAARRAAALRSHREAAAQYARALRFADTLPPAERARLYEGQSYECYLTNQVEEAHDARRMALDLWQSIGDEVRLGESHRWMSRLNWLLGQNAAAEAHARRALAVLEPAGFGRELAWAYSNYSLLHMLAGREPEAVEWGERAIAAAERLGDLELLAHALNNVGSARGQVEEDGESGMTLGERGLSLALGLELEEHVARAYTNLGWTAGKARRFPSARRHLAAGIAYCTDHDLDTWRFYMMGWLAMCEVWEGRCDEAIRVAEEILRQPKLAVPSRIQPLVVLGRVRARRGEPGAEPALDEALALASDTGELQRLGHVRSARAEAAWLAGNLDRVREEVAAAFELAVSRDDPWMIGELGFWLWRAGALSSPPARAARPYLLQMTGFAREAAARWRAIGCPYEAAMALADLEDEDALREAHATLAELGARPSAARVARRLRERGVRHLSPRRRRSPRANPAGVQRTRS